MTGIGKLEVKLWQNLKQKSQALIFFLSLQPFVWEFVFFFSFSTGSLRKGAKWVALIWQHGCKIADLQLLRTNLPGYAIRKPNTADPEKGLQWPWLTRLTIDRRRRTCMHTAGWSSGFLSIFLRLSNNFGFAFLALKVPSPAFTWNIAIWSAKMIHLFRCSLRGEFACGPLIQVLQHCSWVNQRAARASAGNVCMLENRGE